MIYKVLGNIVCILFADDANAFYSDTNVKALKQTYPNGYKRKKHFEYQENQVILFKDKNEKIKEPLKLKIDGEEIM